MSAQGPCDHTGLCSKSQPNAGGSLLVRLWASSARDPWGQAGTAPRGPSTQTVPRKCILTKCKMARPGSHQILSKVP